MTFCRLTAMRCGKDMSVFDRNRSNFWVYPLVFRYTFASFLKSHFREFPILAQFVRRFGRVVRVVLHDKLWSRTASARSVRWMQQPLFHQQHDVPPHILSLHT